MPPKLKPLALVKKGLDILKSSVKEKADGIRERLAQKKEVSAEEEEWLDHGGNTVDEERVIDILDGASDYERAVENKLDAGQRELVAKLKKLGAGGESGNEKAPVNNKRKRPAKPIDGPKEKKSKGEKPPVFEKKENATMAQRIEILKWHKNNGQNQTKTARHWDQKYPNLTLKGYTISRWLKDEATLEALNSDSLPINLNAKRTRQTEHPEVEEMMSLWVMKAMQDKIQLTGEVIRQKWNQFADQREIPKEDRLNLSDGWLDKFKKRHGLREFRRHGEAETAQPELIQAERERVQKLLEEGGWALKDIFNMDETGLFYAMVPDRGLSNERHAGIKGNKVRITYAFTMNADGSEKRPAFIIGKAKKPRDFQGKTGEQLGFYYRNNATAWMTTVLYQEWLLQWDVELREARRRIVLLQDNFSGHVPPDDLQQIKVINFAPNLTPHVQPADAGIIRCFKAHYRALYIHRAIDRYDRGVTPAKIYDIKQLEAMRIAETAWDKVDTTTIQHCWYKTGILPDSLFSRPSTAPRPTLPISSLLNAANPQSDPITAAEDTVLDVLDQLEQTGMLQPNNRMNIESLLNPAGERDLAITETTDQEIFEAVMRKKNGGDNEQEDADGEDDSPEVLIPSRREALQAVGILQQFLQVRDDDFSRRLEGLLSAFGRSTRLDAIRAATSTEITDYFSPIRK